MLDTERLYKVLIRIETHQPRQSGNQILSVPPVAIVWYMRQSEALPLVIGAKGRSVLPAPVRRAAQVGEGAQMLARAEGPGRIVLETPEAVQARVWAAAPAETAARPDDASRMRADEVAIADANFARRSLEPSETDAARVGAQLLTQLGL